jgi:uncharacterized damage-inducible protein DinB
LGERNPLQVIAATPERLGALVNALGRDRLERAPAPGKWSVRKILCHLADTELVFAFRLRQAVAEPHHVIQPFDQDAWASLYDSFGARAALDVFTAVRKWNITLIDAVPPSTLTKLLTHPERGEMTFKVLIETIAGHDLNHLTQIESIASWPRETAGA